MDNYIDIIFGAILGFGLSLLLQLFNTVLRRKKALKLLKLEYPEVSKTLTGLVNSAETVNGISSTEIPNLHFVVQTEYLLHLKRDIRSNIYSINKQFEQAERLRKLAYPLLGVDNKRSRLNSLGTLYLSCLKEARNQMEQLIDKV